MGGTVIDQRVIPWKALNTGAIAPLYGSAEAAGGDLHANHMSESAEIAALVGTENEPVIVLKPGERRLFKTGVAVELPPGTYAKIEPRSGLALKNGIIVMGGVVDSDYRGDVGVILLNAGTEDFPIKHGDRIAQLVVQPYIAGVYQSTNRLEGSERGLSGFGSTGV
ncbi:MAG: dUTP diphosphatase [Stutzerimonas stutzeri]|nr:MAG: dUTP diphosphatase [Stutzerimonas stutzeri]